MMILVPCSKTFLHYKGQLSPFGALSSGSSTDSGYRHYEEVIKPKGTITDGIDHGILLIVDSVAMASLLDPKKGVEPWVWLVEEADDSAENDADDASVNDRDDDDEPFPGHFPVAISSLMPDVLPMIELMGLEELWACCAFNERDSVWTSAFGAALRRGDIEEQRQY